MQFNRRQLIGTAGGAAFASALGLGAVEHAAASVNGKPGPFRPPAGPRSRIMYLNDLAGDIDGLFATVHAVLSTSIELRGIVGTGPGQHKRHFPNESSQQATETAHELLAQMGRSSQTRIYEGSSTYLSAHRRPVNSAGVEAVITEALRTDTNLPLYVTVGGGLTEVASALMIEPKIADRFTLVWIGGGQRNSNDPEVEYNFAIDPLAAQYVFNHTDVRIWQVPAQVYKTCMVSDTELQVFVASCGDIGNWLYGKVISLSEILKPYLNTGETWTLGDSPLVLLTALNDWVPSKSPASGRSATYQNTGSSSYEEPIAPQLDSGGASIAQMSGRRIRLYTSVDTRLMFGDFFAKLRTNYPH